MTVFFALPRSSVVTLLLPFPFVKITKNLSKNHLSLCILPLVFPSALWYNIYVIKRKTPQTRHQPRERETDGARQFLGYTIVKGRRQRADSRKPIAQTVEQTD